MPDSRQLDILKRMTIQLEGITPDNGYEFDCSGRVFRGRRGFGASDPDVVLSILEHLQGDISVETAGINRLVRQEDWILLVQGWLLLTDMNHLKNDAYRLKACG